MERHIKTTADGSSTVYIPAINQMYHSHHGAVQESVVVYLQAGLEYYAAQYPDQKSVRVFEMGFGTGLNALLTLQYASAHNIHINYDAIERYPLTHDEYSLLNYDEFVPDSADLLQKMHQNGNENTSYINSSFTLNKKAGDIKEHAFSSLYDVVYYDAFSPDSQPELWTTDIFEKIYAAMNIGGVLTTYCSKSVVRRNLQSAGFFVEKLPGPWGKREILRAVKNL